MQGRKPKPTELRIVEGNREHRPINNNGPRVHKAAPLCPTELTGTERIAWRYLVRELDKMGCLATSDRGIMTAYCCAWAMWTKAHRILRELGEQVGNPEVIPTEKGNMIQSPWLGIQNRALADVVKYGSFLGLDPTSRTRIKLDEAPTKSLREELMA